MRKSLALNTIEHSMSYSKAYYIYVKCNKMHIFHYKSLVNCELTQSNSEFLFNYSLIFLTDIYSRGFRKVLIYSEAFHENYKLKRYAEI